MKIYTKTGDQGETCLFDGSRTSKDDLRLDLIGDIDELSAHLGLVHSLLDDAKINEFIVKIIHNLFHLNAHLAGAIKYASLDLSEEVANLESSIDKMDLSLPTLVDFIYPLGSQTIATIHIARTICRRAERKLVAAGLEFKFHPTSLQYLNRLSDWLFTLARYVAENNQIEECILKKPFFVR